MAGKDNKSKREGRLKRFIRETAGELRRVSWPTGPEARRMTYIVIVVMVIMAIFLGIIDLGARELLALVVPG
jgi:preprotein translocase subunit SecE